MQSKRPENNYAVSPVIIPPLHYHKDCHSHNTSTADIIGSQIFFLFDPFIAPISWYPIGSYSLVSSLQLPHGLESRASSDTRPNQAALPLDTVPSLPGSQPHQCVGGNTIHLAIVSACTAPDPPQESLLREGTRTSLPAKHSLNPDNGGPIVHRPHGSPGHGRMRQNLDSNQDF